MDAHQMDPKWTPLELKCLAASRYASIFACAVGAVGLAGWVIDVTVYRGFSQSFVRINPTGAVCLILCGLSVIFSKPEPRYRWPHVTTYLNLTAAIFAASRLISIFSGFDFGLDLIFFRQTILAAASSFNGRMSVEAAVLFLLFGAAMFCLNSGSRRLWMISEGLLMLCFTITIMSLTDYIYGSNFVV